MSATLPPYQPPDPVVVEQRRAWAQPYIAAGREAPAYGTPEWLALPEGPAKVAGVVRAAECWAREDDDLEERLRYELAMEAYIEKAADDELYVERRDAHHRQWSRKGKQTPHPAKRTAEPAR